MKKLLALFLAACSPADADAPSWSGIYPHLAFFNEEGECGTGAVVPWADRLWVITYGPHLPLGSTDKLYEITPDLHMTVRPESVGGTPANRMIHRESGQLVIGPYFIDGQRRVRVVRPEDMPGRLTGNARHLTAPANKIYFATMEEGLYEVDVSTLEAACIIKDGNKSTKRPVTPGFPAPVNSKLPGYHGKGLYSGQGRVVYANNGERGKNAVTDPRTPSGALGESDGRGDWQLVRRNQFTEVTGPGGLEGNTHPEKDPLWSVGWDSRSLILMLLDGGKWHSFRLPKASHCYDGAHGWNTEWPRIRDIGERNRLMTMHGMFWKFPETFSAANSAGIRPRSTYLKVIGDFCRWKDGLVFGCDDAAKSAFLNTAMGGDLLAPPGQSHSNLWFTSAETPDLLGPALGRGAVWLRENVIAGKASEPFLFAGFERRTLHLAHKSVTPVRFTLETDLKGDGTWSLLKEIPVAANGAATVTFTDGDQGEWIRIRTDVDASTASAVFSYSNPDPRVAVPDDRFQGISPISPAVANPFRMRVRGGNKRSLLLSPTDSTGRSSSDGCYELGADMKLRALSSTPAADELRLGTELPHGKLRVEAASLVFTGGDGHRYRIPRGDVGFDTPTSSGLLRIQREVCTERYLFNCHGTFYELPTENAGGFAKIRPISSHRFAISDFASYRGLFVMTGIDADASGKHIIRSEDGKLAVWAGAIDDLWKLGKPVGTGGPWLDTAVKAGVPSDPYLFAGFDRKVITLSHRGAASVAMRIELDVTGEGDWMPYEELAVKPGEALTHSFPAPAQAYWIRVVAAADVTATAQLEYR